MAISRYPRLHLAVAHAGLLPLIFFALFPFYFMLITSLKGDAELYDLKAIPFLIRQGIVFEHYSFLLRETLFSRWLLNSLLVSVVATVIAVVIGTIAAYALARLRFRGAESFGLAVFITYLVPPSLLFLPLSQVVNALGLTDSIAALMVTYPPSWCRSAPGSSWATSARSLRRSKSAPSWTAATDFRHSSAS